MTKKASRKKYDSREVEKVLSFPLTEKELLEKAKELCDCRRELQNLEEKLSKIKAQHKSDVSRVEAEARALYHQIETKTEDRMSKCLEVMNYDDGVVEYKVNGQVMESRVMRQEERQVSMTIVPQQEEEGEV